MQVWNSVGRFATLLLGLSMISPASADEPKIEGKETEDIKVTCPDPGQAILRGSPMTVNGTVQVADGAKAPDVVTFRFLNDQDVQIASHSLVFGQESESGTYKKTEASHLFWINLDAPTQVGACRLVVETDRLPLKADVDRAVLKEHAKPLKLDIK